MKRLAIVVSGETIGGHEMQLVRFVRVLELDHHVTVIALSQKTDRFFSSHGCSVEFVPFRCSGKIWRQWMAANRLSSLLRPLTPRFDSFIVSGGTIEACVAPARAIKLRRPTTTVSAYIPMYIDRSVMFGAIGVIYNCASRLLIKAIDRFITINRIQARLIASHYRRPVSVVRNVITPIAPPKRDRGPRLIFVGRLDDHQKNLTGLIQLLDHPNNPFKALYIYGSGPDEIGIAAQAAAAEHIAVTFHGWVSHTELSRELGLRDILVMNSRFEGEPMIVRELASAGIPTVATDIPGFRGLLPRRSRYKDQAELLAVLRRFGGGHVAP